MAQVRAHLSLPLKKWTGPSVPIPPLVDARMRINAHSSIPDLSLPFEPTQIVRTHLSFCNRQTCAIGEKESGLPSKELAARSSILSTQTASRPDGSALSSGV